MESLLLLALFLLLPLIEQLVKFLRRRAEDTPAGAGPPPPPALPGPPPVIEETPRRLVRTAPRPGVLLPASRPVALPMAPPAGRRRRVATRGLHSPTGLRRAVVLMTILGPCRAARPDTWDRPLP